MGILRQALEEVTEIMEPEEALNLLNSKLDDYCKSSYTELAAKIGDEEVVEVTGPSGTAYQIEIQIVWDGKPSGDIRVLGAVDDGGWRAFVPLTADVVIRRDLAEEK
jgi:hypothetical protein